MTPTCGCALRASFWGKLQQAREEAIVRRDRRLPLAGSVLKRSYRGHAIVVKVLDDGFEYNGQRHQSLSAIASQVTGTRWNVLPFSACSSRSGRDGTTACVALRHLHAQVD